MGVFQILRYLKQKQPVFWRFSAKLSCLLNHQKAPYPLHAEDAVLGVVCQGGHPAELPVKHVEEGGGVEHALLEPLQEGVVLLREALGHRQRLLQLLLQWALQGFIPRAVCERMNRRKSAKNHENYWSFIKPFVNFTDLGQDPDEKNVLAAVYYCKFVGVLILRIDFYFS